MLVVVLEQRPRVASFHFGLPNASAVRRIKEAGCLILSSATTVAEARALEAGGADLVIAQGYEAGGHRGSFSDSPGAGFVGTMALVPQIVMPFACRSSPRAALPMAVGSQRPLLSARAGPSSARRFSDAPK